MNAEIRCTNDTDREAILNLLDAAFAPSRFESALVDSVISGNEPYFDWVVLRNGRIGGYVLYTAATREKNHTIGFHLAPVAVDPDLQGIGLGSELIRRTLDSESLKESAIFVLGQPAFYERFGFKPVTTAICPYDESNDHFRALRWKETAEHFVIGYCRAFATAGESSA